MPEYIVSRNEVARVTTGTWLGRYWLSLRTLQGDDTELSGAEAVEFLRGQAKGNPSAAIRRRCWLAMERYGVKGVVSGQAETAPDENKGR